MKITTTLFAIFLLATSFSFAQKKIIPKSIINGKVSISKYHNLETLNNMSKGALLNLYTERIEVILNILPNIAFATKPGVTLGSLGIPVSKENIKHLDESHEATSNYIQSTLTFQRSLLPYSDTNDLKAAILFYEETLKSLHTYNDF